MGEDGLERRSELPVGPGLGPVEGTAVRRRVGAVEEAPLGELRRPREEDRLDDGVARLHLEEAGRERRAAGSPGGPDPPARRREDPLAERTRPQVEEHIEAVAAE